MIKPGLFFYFADEISDLFLSRGDGQRLRALDGFKRGKFQVMVPAGDAMTFVAEEEVENLPNRNLHRAQVRAGARRGLRVHAPDKPGPTRQG